jgi:GNAT superfamily N-acetyltransferase
VPADPDIVRCWVTGWALSRHLKPPTVLPECYYVHVGEPQHQARYVLPSFEPQSLLALASRIHAPWTFIKVCAQLEPVAEALPTPWKIVQDLRVMMTAALTHSADIAGAAAPSREYSSDLCVDGDLIGAQWRDRAGTVVASGRAVMVESSCIFDQIAVHEDHRRRGLGRAVVELLRREAIKRDRKRGILVATSEGKALYSTLGWEAHSPYASAVIS